MRVSLIERGDVAEVRLSGGRGVRLTVTDDGERLLVLPEIAQRLESAALSTDGGLSLTTTWGSST